jgi:hypothetical protein
MQEAGENSGEGQQSTPELEDNMSSLLSHLNKFECEVCKDKGWYNSKKIKIAPRVCQECRSDTTKIS